MTDDSEFAQMLDAEQLPIGGRPNYLPTPAEIREACAEIRAGWSVEEELRRRCRGFERVRATIPGVDRHSEQTDRATVSGFATTK